MGDGSGPVSELEQIRHEIAAAPENAWAAARGWRPLYVADSGARCVVVGQAPGIKAQTSGIPWNDASGQRLIEWLGIDEETFRAPSKFAILPMDFYFPGKGPHGDLPPRPEFASTWHPRLLAAMPNIRLTLLIGDYAQRHYLGTGSTLTERVRRFSDYLPDRFPLVHPSPLNFRWQAKNSWFAKDVLPALRRSVAEAIDS